MHNVYLFELSDIFDGQVYLPYSSGVVWSYVKKDSKINNNFILKDWFYYRNNIKNIIEKINNPQFLLFSCFSWNWNLNCEIARLIKNKYPNCLIIFGGQHQPLADRSEGFFAKHSYVDVLIHGEGEETVKDIFLAFLEKETSFKNIPGITININNQEYKTLPRQRLNSIHNNPSPFLDGSYDYLIKKNNKDKKLSFHATVESVRGCPYSCSFCEIGEKYYQKIKINYEKTKKEIDWIAKNKIEYVTDSNSNFGILFEQDYDLAKYVVKVIKNTSYPKSYRVTWAKDKADKVLKIAKVFEEANATKGVTIALQSMNKKVLEVIKRKNIDNNKLSEFIKLYEKNNVSSYVELIWGLPSKAGMGSSSAFTVGLINAISNLNSLKKTKREISLEAINLEQNILKEVVGSQDQIATCYGGLNHIKFKKNGQFSVNKLKFSKTKINNFESKFLLFFSGITRSANKMASSYVHKLNKLDKELNLIDDCVSKSIKFIKEGCFEDFGYLLDYSWQIKKELNKKISNDKIDFIYRTAKKNGAIGGKLLGAGSGGFVLIYADEQYHEKIIHSLKGFINVPIKFDSAGSQIIYNSVK
ncbi:MAG: hypothetical protein CMI58_06350 [Parcubacteria group bacterium]|nr:hypothetical protein [Parcubacteria group bacterium]